MKPYIIGIAGGSSSGKSTFINKIEGRFGNKIAILHYDNYYREQVGVAFKQRAAMNYDHPDSLETDLLVKHLEELKRGHAIQSPAYDFSQHNRYVEPTKARADILTYGEPSDAVLDLISMKIDGMLRHAAEN